MTSDSMHVDLNVIGEDVLTGEMPAKAVSHEEHHL